MNAKGRNASLPKRRRSGPPTVARSRDDLLGELTVQIALLTSLAAAYDAGQKVVAIGMASPLAILLLDDGPKLQSLLGQLDMLGIEFRNSAKVHDPDNRMPDCLLAAIHIDSVARDVFFVSMLSAMDLPHAPWRRSMFVDWWTEVVVRGADGVTFSRRELVEEVRHRDGAAHLAPKEFQDYVDFKSGRYLGWTVFDGGKAKGSIAAPHLPCLRQIAHEVLLSLQATVPECFSHPYQFPADPLAGKQGQLFADVVVKGDPGKMAPFLVHGDISLQGSLLPLRGDKTETAFFEGTTRVIGRPRTVFPGTGTGGCS
jgi:hypothetical protein